MSPHPLHPTIVRPASQSPSHPEYLCCEIPTLLMLILFCVGNKCCTLEGGISGDEVHLLYGLLKNKFNKNV